MSGRSSLARVLPSNTPKPQTLIRHAQIRRNPSSNPGKKSLPTIDHSYISKILSRKDWFLLLNQEFKAKRLGLDPQSVISVLQNQENPVYPLSFYTWVLNISPQLARNQSVRGALGNLLYRKGPVLLDGEFVRKIRDSGCRISEDVVCVLFGSWGRLGLAKYCVEVFDQVSYLGIRPSTRLYNAVIDALVKANAVDLAYLKFQQMEVDKCRPDRYTYNILIHGVCKDGVVDEALRLVRQMEGLGLFPNVFTFTILIDGFCNAKRIDEAFKTWERMKEKNVSPNEATFRSLINGVFRAVPPLEAFELIYRFVEGQRKLPRAACATVLQCLVDNSLAREAAKFLRQTVSRGYVLDSFTLNFTMTSLIKGLDIEELCDTLEILSARGLRLGFSTHLALVEALFKAGKLREGNRYLNQMLVDRLLTNVFSYNMVIDCFSKINMIDRALEVFGEMRRRGVVPNLVTFNTLIAGHSKAGDIGQVRELLKMLLMHGFKPDIYTFSSLIDGLCRNHQIEDATDCFIEMAEWDITPNAITYNILIRSFCVIGDISKSMSLLKKMQAEGIQPDVFSFNALIQKFCTTNKIEKAQRMFATMLALDLSPDNFTYGSFIKVLCQVGRFDDAKELFFSMEASGCNPDTYICNSYIDALVQSARSEEARYIFMKYKEKGMDLKPIPVS